MAQIDRHRLVHRAHVIVANLVRLGAHAEAVDATAEIGWTRLEFEQLLQRLEFMHHVRQQPLLPPVPVFAGDNRARKADVHVGVLEQQVALDDQFLGKALVDAAVKQASRLVQDVVADPDRVKGDVAGHDDGRLRRLHHQQLDVVEIKLLRPAFDAIVLAGCVIVQQRGLEGVQRQRDHRGAAMVLAAFVGGAGKYAVLTLLVDHALVLDHTAFRENDELAIVQDFPGQERKQVRHVVRHDADRIQELAEAFVAAEKFGRGDRATIGAAGFMNQVLRDEGFEAGEMIE